MTTLNKKRLLSDLKNKEFRQVFYAEHIAASLPIQTRELRNERKLTQSALAKLIGTDQKNISDWENPNYEFKPQIGTLMKLANAFDVPLIVRFGSWEELWDWENNLTLKRLAPRKFEDALPDLEEAIAESETPSEGTKSSLTQSGISTLHLITATSKAKPTQVSRGTQARLQRGLYPVGVPTLPEAKPKGINRRAESVVTLPQSTLARVARGGR